jgi:diaminopimelate decarboxylase
MGLSREQLFDAYKIVKSRGVKTFGLHTMIASNELNADYFVDTAEILFDSCL